MTAQMPVLDAVPQSSARPSTIEREGSDKASSLVTGMGESPEPEADPEPDPPFWISIRSDFRETLRVRSIQDVWSRLEFRIE
jgi:hypothetical protein